MRRLLLLVILFVGIGEAGAQYFQTGEDPASIHWRQLNTENFQLIYPDYYERQAQNLANVLEQVYNYGSYSLDYKPNKISVILHTQTVQSNGLVGWAPKRAEFYTTPHQGIYPQDWLEQLALHEFRHVVQIDKINENLPKLIKLILGEQGTALIFGIHLPWWFIEGDAVVTETALSRYGRGRLPSFLMEHQAQVVEKGVFSYDKSYFGSYRDFVPNHYKLGYYLVGGSRIQYGSDIWEKILQRAGEKPVTFSPVNRILKEETGLTKIGLYYSVFDSLQRVWQAADQEYVSTGYQVISPPKKAFTSYQYNHWLNNYELLSYKTSFNEIPSFVKIDKNGNEERLYQPGTIFNESVGYRDSLIIWSEQIDDPRWAHSGKSLIRIFDIETEKIVEIDTEFKSFNPAISPDKKKFVVVETDFSNNYYLSVYHIPDGNLIDRYQTAENNYFFSPQWINNNDLAAIILNHQGKWLVRATPESKKMTVLHHENLGEISDLKVEGDNLYFISSYTGKNCLYRMNLSNRQIVRLYESRFGADSPAISDNQQKAAISDYTADGFRLIKIMLTEAPVAALQNLQKANYSMAEILAEQEPGVPDFIDMDTLHYPSKKYSKAAHLINVHSWAPVFVDVDSYEFWPGFSIMSQNKLGTAETILGYRYYLSEKTGQFYAGYKFKGWYPVFNGEITSGNRASDFTFINQYKNQQGEIVRQDTSVERIVWGETNANADVWLPLDFTKGHFNRRFQPQISYNFTINNQHNLPHHNIYDGTYHSAKFRLYYHQLLKTSYRDLYPDFGFVLDLAHRNSPFGTLRYGNLTTVQSILYLPGAMNNHGIKIYGGYQTKMLEGTRGFSDALRYPRGWGKANTTQMYSAAFDYAMPLIYPDWKIDWLLYIRRASISLFADFGNLKGNVYEENKVVGTYNKNISSFGTELTFDINLLRFYAPVNTGVRTSYLPELKRFNFDFLISINFASF